MKISKLIRKLENFQTQYGDCAVVVEDDLCCDSITLDDGYGTKHGDTCVLRAEYDDE
tara:strand:- start:51 stop:221 length:171 start_codon:yes stop_codon:yes gene_type:complete